MDPATEQPAKPGSHYQPSLTIVLVILVAFIAGAFLILRTPAPAKSGPSTVAPGPGHHVTKTTVPPPKSPVRVQVANGTSAPNAAAHFTLLLQTQGWNTQAPLDTTAPAPNSAVYYGPNQKASALTIASELKIPPSAVSPTTAAVPVRNASSVDVVVVIGTALAGKGFPAVTPASTASTAAS